MARAPAWLKRAWTMVVRTGAESLRLVVKA